jgi:heme exporter protein B
VSARRALAVAAAVCAHDLRAELRRPLAWSAMLLFGLGSAVALQLALGGSDSVPERSAVGATWVVLTFAALLGSGRVLTAERESGTWDALLLAPVDRTAIYLGKVASSAALALALHAVLVPTLVLTLRVTTDSPAATARLVAAVALADLGFAAVGVLAAGVALRAAGRELLAATLQLPLTLPLVIGAVAATVPAAAVDGRVGHSAALAFLALYDATFLAVGVAGFAEVAVD